MLHQNSLMLRNKRSNMRNCNLICGVENSLLFLLLLDELSISILKFGKVRFLLLHLCKVYLELLHKL